MPACRWRIRSFVVTVTLLACLGQALAQSVYHAKGPWIDDQGHLFALANLQGSYTVFTMAYGACRRVCSTSLRVVENLHALARERHIALNFAVIGLEPDDDKPSDWAAFRVERKLQFDDFQFLSGDEAATTDMARRLGLHYWHYGEHTMHDFRIVLVSPEGRIVRKMEFFDEDPAMLLP